MRRRFPILITLFSSLIGCGPKLQDVTSKYEAAAHKQLKNLGKVLHHCRTFAPLEDESLPGELKDVVFVDRIDQSKGNARTIWLDAYDNPATVFLPIHWSYREGDNWWHNTSRAISDHPPEYSSKELESLAADFEDLAQTEYVLVIKTREYNAPEQIVETSLFQLGSLLGEAHLHRLSTGEYLGGWTFVAVGQSLGTAGIDFTLDATRPEAAVRDLTDRLYGNIHDFAQGSAATNIEGVDSIFEIEDNGPFLAPTLKRRQ